MPLLPTLAYRNEHTQIVVDELEQLVASINVNFTSATGDLLSLQEEIDDLQDQIDDIIASLPHNLLSARHPDTIPASPTPGALIRGTPQDVETDFSPYWLNGLTIPLLASDLDPGDNTYWLDGLPISGALGGLNGDVKWEKVDIAALGDVWTVVPGGSDWRAPASGGGVGATAYSTADQAMAGGTETVIAFGASQNDTGGFWSSGAASRLTVPATGAGVYAIGGQVLWGESLGAFRLRILVNGSTKAEMFVSNTITPAYDMGHQVRVQLTLAAGDYVQLSAQWTYSVLTDTRTAKSGAASTFLQMVRV